MRWLTNFYDFRFKWTTTAGIGIHTTKAWLSQLMNFKNAIWHFRRYAIKLFLNVEKMPQKRMECFRLLFDHLAWIEHQFLNGIRDSRKAGSLWGMMRSVGGVRKSIHQSWLAKRLGLLCWGFKGDQQEIPSEEASTLQIRSVIFPPGQYTSPQLHPCYRLFKLDWHQDSSSASLQSRPCSSVTFGYSPSSEAVVMRQLRWKRLWWRSLTHSHKRTSMGPSRSCWNGTSALQPGTRVSCVYYQ